MTELPSSFVKHTQSILGRENFELFEKSFEEQKPTSVRLNPFKCHLNSIKTLPNATKVPWCEWGYYLNNRANFTFDPLFHAGVYYVQEAASMFLFKALEATGLSGKNIVALDLCAAPGGKSTLVSSFISGNSVLFANEAIYNRANILVENIQKFGNPNVIVTNNFAYDYKKTNLLFDLIVADVPCSGEGMFRKDENAIKEWSETNVHKCATLQKEIIGHIWDNLKEGGFLVYSTCTLNIYENEENIKWIINKLGAECVKIETNNNTNIISSLDKNVVAYRFVPGITKSEGLFMCLLRKTSKSREFNCKKEKKVKDIKIKNVANWIKNSDNFCFDTKDDKIMAIPNFYKDHYYLAKTKLKVLHAGIMLGTLKGKDTIPHTSLALSCNFNLNNFVQAEVDYNTALLFLRKESFSLPATIERGFVVITYKGVPLGFVKNLGNRANNLYISEWKIKSGYLPNTKVVGIL